MTSHKTATRKEWRAARIHYLDVAAEVEVALSTINRYAELAPAAESQSIHQQPDTAAWPTSSPPRRW